MNNQINNEESKKFVFKVGVIVAAIVLVFLIGAGLLIGIFLFVGGKSSLNKMAENYEVYDAEIYAKKYGDKIIKELVLNYGKDINQTGDEDIGGLYQAIKHNNIKAVKFFIENNANVEIATFDGTTPLVLAIEENKPKIVELLIKEGKANIYGVYAKETEKYPIYCAVKNKNLNMIKILLDNNFDLKRESYILSYAMENSDENIVKYLVENGADMYSYEITALYQAVLNLNPKLVEYFLDKGASIEKAGGTDVYGNIMMAAAGSKFNNSNDKSPVDLTLLEKSAENSAKITEMLIGKADKKLINDSLEGKTPLIIAVGNSYIDTAKILIENGANINAVDIEGWSALSYAVNNGDIEIAKLLLENKAKIKDELLLAIKSPIVESSINIMKLLIDNKANINYTDENGFTPLNITIESGDMELTKFLITNGANVNSLMQDGVSLIGYAIAQNNMDLLQILIENGANVNYTNGDSWADTPLKTASRLGLDNVVRILLTRNADINAVDMNGNTALHTAALNSQLSIVKLLLEKNPNLDIQNKVGNTALHLAVISGNIDIVGELVLKGANTRIRNNDGKYPRDIARANNSAAIFEVLREAENKLSK
ncbi:ankyrin repeat domain-containing protein [Brachyspira aalborgi]|uniref:Ankyrin repeat domain-containing protein n=1 Tax=Brachyspira aalborgi TaxID=29522 RepID=A0A5C8GGH4_9SPIR|nr:ankyrin repeat domain-containing protein [Brachyspira aalborgi]TXJ60318.1 ankyrin repeat domain-containing protein [Brachyspira aalborgi]